MHYFRTLIPIAALLLAVLGCDDLLGGTDDGGAGDGGSTTPDTGAPPPGLVTTKAAGQPAEADFTTGKEQYLVVPYSVSNTYASAIYFDVKVSGAGSTATSTHRLRVPPKVPLYIRKPLVWARWKDRLAVEAWLRARAEKAAGMKMSAPPEMVPIAGTACMTSAKCPAGEVCHNKTCSSTVTINSGAFSNSATFKADVKVKGSTAAILVDQADTTITNAMATKVLKKFEDLIYKRNAALFGNPKLKSGSSLYATDKNGDGLVWIVMTSKVSDKISAVGFFDRMDFTDDTKSNKADILYIDSASAAKDAYIYAIMAHEFQHMLNFAARVFKPKANGGTGSLPALWTDEGQAHLAEGACGYGGENVTLLVDYLFTGFESTTLFAPDKTSKPGDSENMRGMAYMFLRYLFEQKGGVTYKADGSITDKGGAAWLKQMHTTTSKGAAAVTATYGDYKKAFDNWIAAVALDGRNVTTYARYVYQALQTDPVTGNQIGIKVRGKMKDLDGDVQDMEGPLETDISGDKSGKIPNGTGIFYLLKGKSGKVTVKVETAAPDFRFALIKVK